jgi:hypothetical protein
MQFGRALLVARDKLAAGVDTEFMRACAHARARPADEERRAA